MQIVVENILVNYTDAGSGKILLCVHGWMHDESSFKQLSNELENEYRIIALDLPNFGGSQTTDKVHSIKDYAEFLAAFTAKLNINNYILVGHSMGCQIAIHATAHKILKPNKLVLLSPAGIRDKRKVFRKTLRYSSVLLRHIIPNSTKKKFYKIIGSDYNPSMSEIHKSIIDKTLNTDIQADAKSLTLPVLIINGTDDKYTPIWMAQILNSEIEGSTLDIMKNGDHFVHQKAAKEVAGILRVFIV